jgi:predicted ribosome quality control (RQC) complex YloA/Tae2 family protein
MNIKLEIIFFVFIGITIVMSFFWMFTTEQRLKRFFLGKKAKDLEDTIVTLENEISKLKIAKEKNEKEISLLNQKLKKSIRGLETIRFNPFPDQGSNQSFAIGLLDEEGDGVVISSLYSRERMSVFAKPIKKNKSEYELTDEEKQVLEKSKVN